MIINLNNLLQERLTSSGWISTLLVLSRQSTVHQMFQITTTIWIPRVLTIQITLGIFLFSILETNTHVFLPTTALEIHHHLYTYLEIWKSSWYDRCPCVILVDGIYWECNNVIMHINKMQNFSLCIDGIYWECNNVIMHINKMQNLSL